MKRKMGIAGRSNPMLLKNIFIRRPLASFVFGLSLIVWGHDVASAQDASHQNSPQSTENEAKGNEQTENKGENSLPEASGHNVSQPVLVTLGKQEQKNPILVALVPSPPEELKPFPENAPSPLPV